jgi:amidase
MPGFQYLFMRLLVRLNAGWLIKAMGAVEQTAESNFEHFPNTPLFNVTGQPAMNVPICWNDDGLPIGMQFVGRYADEATMFRLAGQLEKAQPWKDRVPSVCEAFG